MIRRFLTILILITITVFGFLKSHILLVFSGLVKWLLQFVPLNFSSLLDFLKQNSVDKEHIEHSIGWLVYYPTYLLFHLLFIYILFHKRTQTRNWLMIGLVSLVASLLGFWFVFQQIGYPDIANFFRDQFRKLFGLPFILLAIEGSRILYSDLNRKIQTDSDSKEYHG